MMLELCSAAVSLGRLAPPAPAMAADGTTLDGLRMWLWQFEGRTSFHLVQVDGFTSINTEPTFLTLQAHNDPTVVFVVQLVGVGRAGADDSMGSSDSSDVAAREGTGR